MVQQGGYGMSKQTTMPTSCRLDGYTGALALIDMLYEMDVINKATYENIKKNTKKG